MYCEGSAEGGCGHCCETEPKAEGKGAIRLADDLTCGFDHEMVAAKRLPQCQSQGYCPGSKERNQGHHNAKPHDR